MHESYICQGYYIESKYIEIVLYFIESNMHCCIKIFNITMYRLKVEHVSIYIDQYQMYHRFVSICIEWTINVQCIKFSCCQQFFNYVLEKIYKNIHQNKTTFAYTAKYSSLIIRLEYLPVTSSGNLYLKYAYAYFQTM